MTNRNAFRWHLILLLAALVVLAGVQPGLAEDQDIERLRQAAEQGHAQAQNRLGGMYEHGRGVGKDYVEAVRWYRKAAEQGRRQGVNTTWASCTSKGRGVGKDDVEAVRWYREAAEGISSSIPWASCTVRPGSAAGTPGRR